MSSTSSVLQSANNFLKLIISGTKVQAHALLDTATRKQLHAVWEILSNILASPFEALTEAQEQLIGRWKAVLSRIVKNKRKLPELISRHYSIVYRVLHGFKQVIIARLNQLDNSD